MNTTTSTSQPALIHLLADGSLTPAVALGENFPAIVSDLPAFYYWKDAIVTGSYVHPAGKFSLDITRDMLDGFTETFAQMQRNGVGVPILMDHAPTAAATLGWIVDVKRSDDRLMELHQFLGESARDIGLRNKVSLGIDPDFTDGKGNHYGQAIVHSAVTPTPIVPGQGEFEPLEVMTLSLRAGLNVERGERSTFDVQLPTFKERSVFSDVNVERRALDVERLPIPSKDLHLAMTALTDAASAKRDLAVARGAIAPAIADEIFALLVRSTSGTVRTLTLSRQDNSPDPTPIALAVFDALARNHPAPLGDVTGLQMLSRLIPGEDADRAALQEKMIALASGR